MNPTYDASSSGSATATSLTIAHTCATNAVLFAHSMVPSGYTITATYAGISMELIRTDNMVFHSVYYFKLLTPASGTNNVVFTSSGSTTILGESASYINSSRVTQPNASSLGTNSGTSPVTVSTTSTQDNCLHVGFGAASTDGGGTPTTMTAGTATTKRVDIAPGVSYAIGIFESTSVTVSAGSNTIEFDDNAGGSFIQKYFYGIMLRSPGTLTLTTEAVSNIGLTTATGNGTVVTDGEETVTARGIVWSTSITPTTSNFISTVSGTTGAFTAPMTGLTANTLYYVRAYATNASGTAYGDQESFTTAAVAADSIYKDIDGVEGETYAVSVDVGGTVGSVTVSLGSTGYSQVINAGAGVTVFEGTYGGLNGLTFVKSATFDGYIEDVKWVLRLGAATIDWDLSTLTNVFPINSSVIFKRLEDKDFDKFRVYRYLDIQFKDLNAYVTVLLKKEANEDVSNSSKQFLVNNTSGEVLPFINKKVSMLTKNYGMRIGLSNNRLDETFTVCQFVISGKEQLKKTFSSSKIISVS